MIPVHQRVTRQADDALDVIDARILRQPEYDDVSPLRRTGLENFCLRDRQAQAVGILLDEYEVALQECRHHRPGRNSERLEDEGPDDQHDEQHRKKRPRVFHQRQTRTSGAIGTPLAVFPDQYVQQEDEAREGRKKRQDQCKIDTQGYLALLFYFQDGQERFLRNFD